METEILSQAQTSVITDYTFQIVFFASVLQVKLLPGTKY